MHRCASDEILFIKENIAGRSYAEMTNLFNKHFALRGKKKLTSGQLRHILRKYKLSNGLPRRFLPGHTPHNKGRISYYFQPGYSAYNYLPVGTAQTDFYGYVKVKVADPDVWESKHTLIWEKANGPVPKGHVIIFADKNKLNFCLDNLIMVSRSELMVMNRNGRPYFFGQRFN
jgi:hypothetical protein